MFSMEKALLFRPTLEELVTVLQRGLEASFREVEVSVDDCPDLRKAPFHLATQGLCGDPSILDVGGVPYLVPTPHKDKIYNMDKLAEMIGKPGCYMMGAGAGPGHLVGVNCELVANLKTKTATAEGDYQSHIVKIDPENETPVQEKLTTGDFALMAQLLACGGTPGKVLRVRAAKRVGSRSFPEAIRIILKAQFEKKMIALGGTFAMLQGKAKIHVMPDFSSEPLTNDAALNNWLKFYDMNAPLVCVGTLVSHDPGLDLRVEHFHCTSQHGEGGHYHYDITPDDVEYLGYFVPAKMMYRVDRPMESNTIGRN